jgi:hypothetical protein
MERAIRAAFFLLTLTLEPPFSHSLRLKVVVR